MSRLFLILAIALGLAAIVLDSVLSFHSTKKVLDIMEERRTMENETDFLQKLLAALIDSETGVRGYLITGNDKYLKPYREAMVLLNNPKTEEFIEQQMSEGGRMEQLRSLVDAKLKDNLTHILLSHSEGIEEARKNMLEGSGKSTMDMIRSIIKENLHTKRKYLRKKEDQLNQQLDQFSSISIFGNVSAFILMGSCLFGIYIYAKQYEKEQKNLRSLEKLRDAIMTNSRAVILTLDPRGVITSCNKAAVDLSPYQETQLIGLPFEELINPEDDLVNLKNFSNKYSKNFQGFADLLAFAKEQLIEEDVIWTQRNGGGGVKRYFEASIAPLKGLKGEFNGYLIEANEITERVKQDEKLIHARVQSENANQAKSRFFSNLSHDLRTPLTAMIGYSDLLKVKGEDHLSEKELSYIDQIQKNGQQLLSMIKDILDLEKIESKIETVNLSEVRVDQLIDRILKEVEIEANKKGVILTVEGVKNLKPIHSDEEKLYRILSNIIANGVKFTDKGSVTILITQDLNTHQPQQIDVVDTGRGIDPKYEDRIFEPFFQVHRKVNLAGEGAGLGLSICKSLSRLLGYHLTFKSKLAEGTTFSLHLS